MRVALLVGCMVALVGLWTQAVPAQNMQALEKEITELVDRTAESVVSIGAYSDHPASRQTARSVGCGVVFDKGSLVLTTASVVGAAHEVEISTRHGLKYKGEVLGIDPAADLAVIRAEGADLVPANFAGHRSLEPGSWIFVVGNAFGSLPSVSMGVVSGAVAPPTEEGGEETLRLSVAVYPGDMGAPVVDTQGEIVGVLVGRMSFGPRGFAARGPEFMPSTMSVAVPGERALAVARDIAKNGSKEHGFLGVGVVDLSDELRSHMRDHNLRGVVVTEVLAPSPAESIGVVQGDVITALGSRKVQSVSSLLDGLGTTKPGDVVTIAYTRGSADFAKQVRLSRFVSEYMRQQAKPTPEPKQDTDAQIDHMRAEIERLKAELDTLQNKR